jgi:hypothetical protein
MRALHLSSPVGAWKTQIRTRSKSEEASKERRKTGEVVFLLWRCEGALAPSQSSQKRLSEGAALVRPLFGQKTAPGAS